MPVPPRVCELSCSLLGRSRGLKDRVEAGCCCSLGSAVDGEVYIPGYSSNKPPNPCFESMSWNPLCTIDLMSVSC